MLQRVWVSGQAQVPAQLSVSAPAMAAGNLPSSSCRRVSRLSVIFFWLFFLIGFSSECSFRDLDVRKLQPYYRADPPPPQRTVSAVALCARLRRNGSRHDGKRTDERPRPRPRPPAGPAPHPGDPLVRRLLRRLGAGRRFRSPFPGGVPPFGDRDGTPPGNGERK